MLSEVIYALKREFSFLVSFISQEEMVRDFDKGKLEVSSTTQIVERAVVLPKQITLFGTNHLAENERTILLDLNDVWFDITENYKVEFDDTRWDIVKIIKHGDNILELVVRHV